MLLIKSRVFRGIECSNWLQVSQQHDIFEAKTSGHPAGFCVLYLCITRILPLITRDLCCSRGDLAQLFAQFVGLQHDHWKIEID